MSSDCPATEGSVGTAKSVILPPSQTAASSVATEELPVSTQVFQDLMELAEDGMVLSQGSHSASCSDRGRHMSERAHTNKNTNTHIMQPLMLLLLLIVFVSTDALNTSLLPSGFVQEELEDQAELFLPKIMCTNSPDNQTKRLTLQLRTETKSTSYTSVRAFIATLIMRFYTFFCPQYI